MDNAWRVGPGLVAALTVIGIATGLGITKTVGCIVSFVPALWSDTPLNVVLSAVMVAFACTSAVTTRKIALCLMGVEFVGFVLFLFFLRGGYAVGYAATPMSQVVQYDALSVAGRVSVLGLLAFGHPPSGRLLFKVAFLGLGAALVIVVMKAALFPIPLR